MQNVNLSFWTTIRVSGFVLSFCRQIDNHLVTIQMSIFLFEENGKNHKNLTKHNIIFYILK